MAYTPIPRVFRVTSNYNEQSSGTADVYEVTGTTTITLLSPARRRKVVVVNAGVGVVTVATEGSSATINGAATLTLTSQYDAVELVANGRTGSEAMWVQSKKNIVNEGLNSLAQGKIFIGDASNLPSKVTPSGDAAVSLAGVVTVSDLTIASEARGDLVRRGATVWERVSAKDAGKIVLGDGTDVISAAMSGHATISASGVVTLDETLIQYATVNISSANITGTGAGQLGHANGYPLVVAPAAGKTIELISATVIYDFATAAYTGGGNVSVNYAGGGAALSAVVSAANSLGAAADQIALLIPVTPTNNQLVLATGVNLVAAAAFTQPGTAAGVVRVKIAYRTHTTEL